ncbi:hypothetical protein PAXRUDRAFT_298909 [Paxillus rubicundulus Ve08.2h10]|uniref:Uncharacterized protein n=1 Tax=Paxillus rubicundulus Ve08.2h10 TaxID=930991 RepID=A0A0D0E059_9AGAM|nr:hypothetical protein PAXRUDRAFT_298909 [Paxillus rubicundulus Ve08.2h10]
MYYLHGWVWSLPSNHRFTRSLASAGPCVKIGPIIGDVTMERRWITHVPNKPRLALRSSCKPCEARRQGCIRLWMSEISDEWKEGDVGLALALFRRVGWVLSSADSRFRATPPLPVGSIIIYEGAGRPTRRRTSSK